jgi:outer membrane protein, heavy metal efflux system
MNGKAPETFKFRHPGTSRGREKAEKNEILLPPKGHRGAFSRGWCKGKWEVCTAMKKGCLALMVFLGMMVAWAGYVPAQGFKSFGQSPHTAEPAVELAQETVTLEQLVHEAEENNPAISASRHNIDAKKAMVLPARTLPDPTFGFQTMGDLIPPQLQQGDPSSARTFSLEQEVPFPGKLSIKGKMAETEASVEEWNHEKTKRDVIADLKAAYFDFYLVHKSLETVSRDKELLQSFAEIAQEKYRVGQGIQQDVFKAQVEISKLLEKRTVLEQRRSTIAAQINSLLYRNPGTPLGRPAELKLPSLSYQLEQLNDMAQSGFPELRVKQHEIERNQYAVDLARKNYYPDFTLGFTYFNRTVPEMYGLALNVKVPLYFWRKQREELASARSSLNSARLVRDNAAAQLYAKLQENYTLARSSEKLAGLYQHDLIPQSRLSLESATASYQVGRADFLKVTDSLLTLLEYELKYYEVVTEFHKALARLEPYVGLTLTP